MRQAFVATIQVLIEAETEGEASDNMSELLSNNEGNGIIDWGYFQLGGQYMTPTERYVHDAAQYEEGEFLN